MLIRSRGKVNPVTRYQFLEHRIQKMKKNEGEGKKHDKYVKETEEGDKSEKI